MRFQTASAILAAASVASAQTVSGTAYGFATGVTGGGDAAAVTPSSADELAEYLSDDTARVIVIDQEFDFTGTSGTGAGCDRESCSVSEGGQYYLGDLSCGGDDNVAVSSITYDTAGPDALAVGSNKSILGVNGKGVLKGKGLSLQSGASNVIIQGIEFTNINPGIVWGGDALDLQGSNDGVWVDHCKFSLIGRMFVVSHYTGSRFTLSNNEFDGETTTSATCNGNHYWTMMFIADGDQVTLDRNYFHDVSGRAPKLGADGVSGSFHATNNYFSNMQGHAFDAYDGVTAILEGNVFESVDTPITDSGAAVSTIFNVPDSSAASSCSSTIGRACVVNSLSSSGDWPSMSETSALSTFSSLKDYLVTPVEASEVASLVTSNAGPSNLGSSSNSGDSSDDTADTTTPSASTPTTAASNVETSVADVAVEQSAAATTSAAAPVSTESASEETSDDTSSETSGETVQQWGQCGGANWQGSTTCASGSSCVVQNEWYSQCVSSSKTKRALRHAHRHRKH
ncbi:pectin lyase fold/virulence factor [Thelonectria olida]|uniref:pectin lyase n=1 Tax=Thelonectria olida TaxID=1576542 RepID=A0A9P8WH63_9HYPO|nr:pectin lyase fold/virulence factor [Thelonectria olida]